MSQPPQVPTTRPDRRRKRKSDSEHPESPSSSRNRTRSANGGSLLRATMWSEHLCSDSDFSAVPPDTIIALSGAETKDWRAKLWAIADFIESTPSQNRDKLWISFAKFFPELSVYQWRLRHYGEIQPVFLCSPQWDEAIREADGPQSAQRLKTNRDLMYRAVQGRLLRRGIPPAEFLPESGWYQAMIEAPEQAAVRLASLRQRMRDDVVAGNLAGVTDFKNYLCHEKWRSFADEYENETQEGRDQVEELYTAMQDSVLAGGAPYDPEEYFLLPKWSAAIALCTDEESARGMEGLYRQMVVGVLENESAPYDPDNLFKRATWDSARRRCRTEGAKELLDQLELECRNKVIASEGEQGMNHPARAWFDHSWDELERDCGTLPKVAQLRDSAQEDATMYFDEWQLVNAPPRTPADISTDAYLEKVQMHIVNQRRLQADEAWLKVIKETEDIKETSNLLLHWQQMRQRHYQENLPLYRPHNIPDPVQTIDLAAQAQTIGFDSPFDQDGHWQYRNVLGQGGFGVATIWVKLNNHGNIIDHEVLKDTYVQELPDSNTWDSPDFWHGNKFNRVPLEWGIVRALNGIPNSENIVSYHAFRIYAEVRMYRIYMEYGDNGTLVDLSNNYRAFGNQGVRDQSDQPLPNNIPLRLAWSIFTQLAQALFIAHYGHDQTSQPDIPFYIPIIHRDIKNDNIFIASRPPTQSAHWPGLPIAKLADWGLATRKSNHDSMSLRCGTPGYMAPEMCSYDEEDTQTAFPFPMPAISEKVDIFSTGMVMLSLLNLDTEPQQYKYDQEDPDWKLTHPNRGVYSRTPFLMALIKGCLERDPSRRPTAEQLLMLCETETEKIVDDELPLNVRGREAGEILLWEDSKYLKWAR